MQIPLCSCIGTFCAANCRWIWQVERLLVVSEYVPLPWESGVASWGRGAQGCTTLEHHGRGYLSHEPEQNGCCCSEWLLLCASCSLWVALSKWLHVLGAAWPEAGDRQGCSKKQLPPCSSSCRGSEIAATSQPTLSQVSTNLWAQCYAWTFAVAWQKLKVGWETAGAVQPHCNSSTVPLQTWKWHHSITWCHCSWQCCPYASALG